MVYSRFLPVHQFSGANTMATPFSNLTGDLCRIESTNVLLLYLLRIVLVQPYLQSNIGQM